MECPNCRASNRSTAKFCLQCGRQLPKSTAQPATGYAEPEFAGWSAQPYGSPSQGYAPIGHVQYDGSDSGQITSLNIPKRGGGYYPEVAGVVRNFRERVETTVYNGASRQEMVWTFTLVRPDRPNEHHIQVEMRAHSFNGSLGPGDQVIVAGNFRRNKTLRPKAVFNVTTRSFIQPQGWSTRKASAVGIPILLVIFLCMCVGFVTAVRVIGSSSDLSNLEDCREMPIGRNCEQMYGTRDEILADCQSFPPILARPICAAVLS